MPRQLPLTPADRRRITRLYARGTRPAEIARLMASTGITTDQVSGIIERAGLPRLKGQVAEMKAQTAREALEHVRAASLADLEGILSDVTAGLKIDAGKLKNAWPLVSDAAGASALMRAKSLYVARLLRVHGIEAPPETGPVNNLAIIFGNPIEPAAETHVLPQPLQKALGCTASLTPVLG